MANVTDNNTSNTNTTTAACEFDRDCPALETCYADVSWREPGCDCNTFYGYVRGSSSKSCTNFGSVTYFWVITGFMLTVPAIVLFLVGFYDSVLVFYYRIRGGKSSISELAFPTLFASLSALFLTLEVILTILNATTPIYSPINFTSAGNPLSDKVAMYTNIERIFVGFESLLGVLAAINIPRFWVVVGYKMSGSHQATKMLSTSLLWFNVAFLVGTTAIILSGRTDIAAGIGAVLIVFLIMAYLVGYRSLKRSLFGQAKNNRVTSKKLEAFFGSIKLTMIQICIPLFVYLVALATYAAMDSSKTWKEFSYPGKISPTHVLLRTAKFAVLLTLFAILNYCHPHVSSHKKSGGNIMGGGNNHVDDAGADSLTGNQAERTYQPSSRFITTGVNNNRLSVGSKLTISTYQPENAASRISMDTRLAVASGPTFPIEEHPALSPDKI